MTKTVSEMSMEINFEMTKVSERFVKRFGATSCVCRAHMETPIEGKTFKVKDVLTEFANLFDSAITTVTEECNLDRTHEDKMRIMVTSSALKSLISTRVVSSGDMSARQVLDQIGKVLQSNEEIPLDRSFTIGVVGLKSPRGSGKMKNSKALKVLDYTKYCKLKRSIITIRNKDNFCCARSIAVGLAMVQRHPKLKQIKLCTGIQKRLALKLCGKANVPLCPCGFRKISRFQGVLGEYQITVIDFHARNATIYEGPRKDKKIVLCKNGDHYDVSNSEKMPAFFAKRFFCDECKIFYNNFLCHPCNDPCNTCLQKSCLRVEGEGR